MNKTPISHIYFAPGAFELARQEGLDAMYVNTTGVEGLKGLVAKQLATEPGREGFLRRLRVFDPGKAALVLRVPDDPHMREQAARRTLYLPSGALLTSQGNEAVEAGGLKDYPHAVEVEVYGSYRPVKQHNGSAMQGLLETIGFLPTKSEKKRGDAEILTNCARYLIDSVLQVDRLSS